MTTNKGTHLIRSTASRKEVTIIIAVNRQIEDIRVIIKGLLGTVTMVNVLRGEFKHTIKSKAYQRCVLGQ